MNGFKLTNEQMFAPLAKYDDKALPYHMFMGIFNGLYFYKHVDTRRSITLDSNGNRREWRD